MPTFLQATTLREERLLVQPPIIDPNGKTWTIFFPGDLVRMATDDERLSSHLHVYRVGGDAYVSTQLLTERSPSPSRNHWAYIVHACGGSCSLPWSTLLRRLVLAEQDAATAFVLPTMVDRASWRALYRELGLEEYYHHGLRANDDPCLCLRRLIAEQEGMKHAITFFMDLEHPKGESLHEPTRS